MSGQRSASIGGAAPSVAAGCALRESRSHHTTSTHQISETLHSCKITIGGNRLKPLALYCWGRGEDGQLGIGDTSDQDVPVFVESLRDVNIRQIACGSGHTVVLTTEGEVYSWGRGDDGRLGHGDNGWKYVPRMIQSFSSPLSMGSNLSEPKIIQVTCGSYHTAAVTSNGELYTWGGGMYGKLGHGSENGHSIPKRVEGILGFPVAHVACGSRHTVAVTTSGAVYSWGDKENGVSGHGDTEGHQYTPKLLDKLSEKRIIQISACGFHTACLTDKGEVYTWGEGKFGRLGHGSERNCNHPRLVDYLLGKRPKQVACGGFHTAVITEDGKVLTFGGGEHGQLGHGDKVNKLKPTLVEALEETFICQISCGWSHSVALTSDGKLYSWGNGDHGKLGHGSEKKLAIPHLVENLQNYKIVRVASYNEHTAALLEPCDDCDQGNSLVPVSSSYLQNMRGMINDNEFSDVTFIVDGQPIYAHRAILVSRCLPFAAMLRSGMRESIEREVRIPNISRPVFLLFLEYIYTDCVDVDVDHAIDLYMVADLYQLIKLRETCCSAVKWNITTENATSLLQHASDVNCQVLKDICMDFTISNFDVISKGLSIKTLCHELLLEILANRP